ncbi:hypothetical protein [Estrella lausannensis]|uniref:Putative secreted protein n=1 Tax=Estrella lausannensis TaxID=483423 RepID=A0A0H5DNA6_9BACT|nr:hypothetical protein [Estrella lausannensis]CRX37612.1 putative secreted protein [Estrella lausannensis]
MSRINLSDVMKKYAITACLLILISFVAAACGMRGEAKKEISLPLLRERVGGEALETIHQAGLIEVEEIGPAKDKGHVYTGFGKPLSDRQAEQLKRLILNDENFEFHRMKSCLFVPKSAMHFKARNQETVTVLFSPWCKQIKVIRQDKETILEADAISDSIERILRLNEEDRS